MKTPDPIILNRPILYLDFDGVLHHEEVYTNGNTPFMKEPGRKLFEWVDILDNILDNHRDISIVLSTSWARYLRYDYSKSMLPPKMQEMCIGACWHSSMKYDSGWGGGYTSSSYPYDNLTRYEQIKQNSKRRFTENWIAIDDNYYGWAEEDLDKLVKCDHALGLSDIKTQKDLINKLKQLKPLPKENNIKNHHLNKII